MPKLLSYGRSMLAVLCCTSTFAGCAGGTSRNLPGAQTVRASNIAHGSNSHATLRILIPRDAGRRRPRYVSPATRSLVAAFTAGPGAGASTTTFAVDLTTATNPNCSPAANSGTICMLSFALAPGPYTASFSTYDGLLDSRGNPTGNMLSADIAFPVTIAEGETIRVTLYGVPVAVRIAALPGALYGSQAVGFTLPVEAGPQQLSVVGSDADGNDIVGAGAPRPTLTTSDPFLKLTAAQSSAPNDFGIALTGSPSIGHAGALTATVTPATASGAGPVAASADVTVAPTFTEYPLPSGLSEPLAICSGSNGALWFTLAAGNTIGRITTEGKVTIYPLAATFFGSGGIAAGPDGALWFTEENSPKIGRITTAGKFTEYPLLAPNRRSAAITAGPDGAMWFTESSAKLGRIAMDGSVTEYAQPAGSGDSTAIAAGPDGALWFTEVNESTIGRSTTTGIITEYPIPTASSQPFGITAGPDKAMWFTENSKVGRISTAGAFTEYPIPTPSAFPFSIATGPDGALWIIEVDNGRIGRLTTAGNFTDFADPAAKAGAWDITAGPDGAMWFTQPGIKIQEIGRAALR